MKKRLLVGLIGCMLAFSLVGCEEETSINVNVENTSKLNSVTLGIDSLISIGNGLWYDSATRIVYWWNGCLDYTRSATTPSPYYAPNGLPYRYNPETNTFKEIGE
jgi:hypothetical protein